MEFSLVSKKAVEQAFKEISLTKVDAVDHFSGWIIVSSIEDVGFSWETDLFPINTQELLEKIAGFEAIVDTADAGETYVHNTGFDALVKIDKTENDTLSSEAYATNQGKINLSYLQWLKYHKFPTLKYCLIVLIGIAVLPLSLGVAIFLVGYGVYKLIVYFVYLKGIKDCYDMGNIIPGIVVHNSPVLIATLTDVTKGIGSYPVIRIGAFPSFKKYHKGWVKIGDRIPMLAIYHVNTEQSLNYWNDFTPWPVEFATKDRNFIGKKYYSISEPYWQYAEEMVKQVRNSNKKQIKIGIEAVDIENSAWKEETKIELGIR